MEGPLDIQNFADYFESHW